MGELSMADELIDDIGDALTLDARMWDPIKAAH